MRHRGGTVPRRWASGNDGVEQAAPRSTREASAALACGCSRGARVPGGAGTSGAVGPRRRIRSLPLVDEQVQLPQRGVGLQRHGPSLRPCRASRDSDSVRPPPSDPARRPRFQRDQPRHLDHQSRRRARLHQRRRERPVRGRVTTPATSGCRPVSGGSWNGYVRRPGSLAPSRSRCTLRSTSASAVLRAARFTPPGCEPAAVRSSTI